MAQVNTGSTEKVKTVNGSKRHIIYFDPDVFDSKILLSAHLYVENGTEIFEYNTIFDEVEPVNDSISDPAPESEWQTLDELVVSVHPKPKHSPIIGARNVIINNPYEYSIDVSYGEPDFNYEWEIDGDAELEGTSGGKEFSGVGVLGKKIRVVFKSNGKITLKCKITNPAGCYRYMIKNVYTGLVSKQMLIVKNPYF